MFQNSLIGPAEEPRPVPDGHDRVARVDVVEVVDRVQPRRLDIIHQEPDVGRQPVRLDGRKVDAKDMGARELVAHYGVVSVSAAIIYSALGDATEPTLNGPNPSSGPYVEDLLRMVADWGEVKPLATEQLHHGVLHVLSLRPVRCRCKRRWDLGRTSCSTSSFGKL